MGIMKTVKFHKIGSPDGEVSPLPRDDAVRLAIELALNGAQRVTIEDVQEPAADQHVTSGAHVRGSFSEADASGGQVGGWRYSDAEIDEIFQRVARRLAHRVLRAH